MQDWNAGRLSPGKLRQWLSANLWPGYGNGLWQESWEDFMSNLARAVQPYAHYTLELSRWQNRLDHMDPVSRRGTVQFGPAVFDPQKESRIILYHSILCYALARVWCANFGSTDPHFAALCNRWGEALGRSKYLDGHGSDWPEQFWPYIWDRRSGSPILE